MRRLLAAMGDTNDQRTWSGIPYCLLEAGKRSGFLHGGLALHPEALRRKRLVWNLGVFVRSLRYGGFQYTESSLEALMAQAGTLPDAEILSLFPLLPPQNWPGPLSFYIDATLKQNLKGYTAQ